MKVTPMMQQFFAAKDQYPDAVLFFRMGDFYEMFFEDAELVSRELGLTLTARNKKGAAKETPMAGVPHHAASGYINRLIAKGYTVAICEQLEDPSVAKGIVKRDVIRVVTPGMVFDTDTLDAKTANYVSAIWSIGEGRFSLAYADISTGELRTTTTDSIDDLLSELHRVEPREIVTCDEAFRDEYAIRFPNAFIRFRDRSDFDQDAVIGRIANGVRLSEDIDFDAYFVEDASPIFEASSPDARPAVAAILNYVVETQRGVPSHLRPPEKYSASSFLILDDSTKQNLELTETLMGGHKTGSLLHTIDKTVTAQGGRLLRRWVAFPLVDPTRIEARLEMVEEFFATAVIRQDVRHALDHVYDLERLCGKVSSGSANARDLRNLAKTLLSIPNIRIAVEEIESLSEIRDRIDPLSELSHRIDSALVEDPPATIKDGGLFNRGFEDDLDQVLELAENGKDWILRYEASEREETGISNLKVKYNKVFGYFIEVTKSNMSSVPGTYIRKQTLTNAERFFTEELKEMEDSIVGATQSRCDLEYKYFEQLRSEVASAIPAILATADALAELDVLSSFAELAHRHDYVRPVVNDGAILEIVGGRHPVVERTLKEERFVPNDTKLEPTCALQIVTGPNMAGKSTIIRQVALITLMAQMGSYVPATSATVGVVDKIFSRVGASDNLAKGHSTFMVEMTETAHILRNATDRSLVILDEIGRGTSTFDGLSIAWAVAEFLHDDICARTMFATHYHELTELIRTLENAQNLSIAVKEYNDDIVFLRKLVKGQANRSYGIQVGRLAGLPDPVVDRAKQVLQNLETGQFDDMGLPVVSAGREATATRHHNPNQLSLFNVSGMSESQSRVLEEIQNTNFDLLSPIEALNQVMTWQKLLAQPSES